jgi:hypothetical protein
MGRTLGRFFRSVDVRQCACGEVTSAVVTVRSCIRLRSHLSAISRALQGLILADGSEVAIEPLERVPDQVVSRDVVAGFVDRLARI